MQFIKSIVLSLLLFLAIPFGLFSQTGPYSRIAFKANQTQLNMLAKHGVAIDYLSKNEDGFIGEFSKEEASLIAKYCQESKVLIPNLEQHFLSSSSFNASKRAGLIYPVPQGFQFGSMGGYLTYMEADSHFNVLLNKYPNLISERDTIGLSYEGRTMYAFKVSDNPNTDEDEPEVLYTALHHAREPMSLMQMVYFLYYICENYNSDSTIRTIVNQSEMYFVPFLNPDGYVYNQSTNPNGGGYWRKNRRLNADSTYGVDLNRNYGFNWAANNLGSSPTPSSNTYRGTSAFSEPETKNMRDFCLSRHFESTLNYHSFGNYLIFPWGMDVNGSTTPDNARYDWMARQLSVENGFKYGTSQQTLNYYMNGCADDWMYGEQSLKSKTFSFTPELGEDTDGFWPAKDRILPLCDLTIKQNINLVLLSLDLLTVNILEQNKSRLVIFPNPSTGQIEIKSDIYKNLDIELYDSQGRLVMRKTLPSNTPISTLQISEGIYHCVLSSKGLVVHQDNLILAH
ncbi:MAG: M14 family zinc carboxypeptidase [Bacteroidia bacterium]